MNSMQSKAWWKRKHSADVVKAKDVRKQARKDVNSASRKVKDSKPKEQSR
jgi:hypothetical protein